MIWREEENVPPSPATQEFRFTQQSCKQWNQNRQQEVILYSRHNQFVELIASFKVWLWSLDQMALIQESGKFMNEKYIDDY